MEAAAAAAEIAAALLPEPEANASTGTCRFRRIESSITHSNEYLSLDYEGICAGVMHSYPRDSISIIVHAAEQGILLHYSSWISLAHSVAPLLTFQCK